MRSLLSKQFKYLGILCLTALFWAAWGPQTSQAQCEACTVSIPEGCDWWNSPFIGYEFCVCLSQWECWCIHDCNFIDAIDLKQVEDGMTLAENGMRLTTLPDEAYFATLDKAILHTGYKTDQAYFGEDFGLVRFNREVVVAFPLKSRDTFTIRSCKGEVIAEARRIKTTVPVGSS